jgi:hypothetical protein
MANTLAMQLDEVEEKQKLNSLTYENSGVDSTKKTMGTQVDYVTLIAARNTPDEWKYAEQAEVPEHLSYMETNRPKEITLNETKSHPQTPYTIHVSSDNANPLSKRKYNFMFDEIIRLDI